MAGRVFIGSCVMSDRSTWGSRLGFVLASAGAAVGLGAIWKFPYLVGSNGGSAFLFPFIVLTFTIGLVLLIAELTVGRAGAGCIVTAFRKLGGKNWGRAGYLGVITGFLILSFYSAIGGWTIAYFVNACLGAGLVADQAQLGAHFASISGDPELAIGYQALFLIITAWVVAYGVSSGIERLSKVLMPLLFILMLIIIVRSLFLPGAFQGIEYLFSWNPQAFTFDALLSTMGFTFFSLCLGSGCMLTYGSYLCSKVDLIGSSAWIAFLTIISSLLGALMVMPAVFAFGLDPSAGPGLTFVTMPAIFAQMPLGNFFAITFYACLLVAAITSSVSMLEIDVAFLHDEWKWSRPKAVVVTTVGLMIVGSFSALSFGPLADTKWLGKTFFDWIDYLTSNISLPIGGLMIAVLSSWIAWPQIKPFISGNKSHLHSETTYSILRWSIAIFAPILVITVLISGI